ncbi:MAG: matrixin family metalloprotease [Pirellulaceae bacterium]|nr:matrixin family metalloprotease [Planctomycetales bacterium]
MAKKKINRRGSGTATTSLDRLRVCVERILPDEIDTERTVRRTIRKMMLDGAGKKLSRAEQAYHKRMAVVRSKKWETGQTLRCRFLHGDPAVQKKVESIAHKWEQHANIQFRFIDKGDAEIRIAFASGSSWSAVGRDALNRDYFPKYQPTMNFGWLDRDTEPDEYQRVVLHEFGHALGCLHEHQSPTFPYTWNEERVYAYFSGPPNYWTKKQIEQNVLRKYSPDGIAATKYDPKSIMLYVFDIELFSGKLAPTAQNCNSSKVDNLMMAELYPY